MTPSAVKAVFAIAQTLFASGLSVAGEGEFAAAVATIFVQVRAPTVAVSCADVCRAYIDSIFDALSPLAGVDRAILPTPPAVYFMSVHAPYTPRPPTLAMCDALRRGDGDAAMTVLTTLLAGVCRACGQPADVACVACNSAECVAARAVEFTALVLAAAAATPPPPPSAAVALVQFVTDAVAHGLCPSVLTDAADARLQSWLAAVQAAPSGTFNPHEFEAPDPEDAQQPFYPDEFDREDAQQEPAAKRLCAR
jgi:hypothetical protein